MSFDNIRLEKGLYTTGKGFAKSLEALDPSENYKGTELEGLDAYQRQLKRFDIKVSGPDSDCVAKFFNTTDSAALFPEFVSRAVRQGIEENNVLDKIIATTTNVDSLDYRAVEIVSEDVTPSEVSEGAHIPEAVIKTKDKLVSLNKRGRMLSASYEAIKFQKLDVFTIMLKNIGYGISRAQLQDAVSALMANGMENFSAESIGNIKYSDLIKLWNLFEPYRLTSMLCTPSVLGKLMNLDEFKDSAAGLNFHATGSLITPFGADLFKVDKSLLNSGIIALDKNYALEKIQAGEVVTDYDRLIDRQLERASVTTIAGFSRIFDDAVKYLIAT